MSIPEEQNEVIKSDNYFAIIPEWILYADISAQSVRLYGILRRFADANNQAWPSRMTLANKMRVSTKTVDRCLKELNDLGALRVQRRTNDAGDPTTNLYILLTNRNGWTPVSRGRDTDVATPMDIDVATGRDIDVAQNQSHIYPEPLEPEIVESSFSDAKRLCEYLADRIEQNGSKRPTVTKNWIAVMEKIIRIDGHSPDAIHRAIDWCQSDSFWAANILSPTALRKQYDRMRLQAKRNRGSFSGITDYLDEVRQRAI